MVDWWGGLRKLKNAISFFWPYFPGIRSISGKMMVGAALQSFLSSQYFDEQHLQLFSPDMVGGEEKDGWRSHQPAITTN